jgi:O-antigen ligase
MPYAFAFLMLGKKKWMMAAAMLIFVVGWIYAGSRSTWIAVLAGMITIIFLARNLGRLGNLRLRALFIPVLVLAVAGGLWWSLSSGLSNVEAVYRLQYLLDPASVPQLNTYGARIDLISQALQYWLQSPVIGIGLTNIITLVEFAHNDFVGIMTELGVVGLGLFGGLLILTVRAIHPGKLKRLPQLSWVSLGTRGALVAVVVSMLFTDTYLTLSLWIFWGLCFVLGEVERQERQQVP